MVFVENAQKSPMAVDLEVLDPVFEFCHKEPALSGINEGIDERLHQLNLRNKRDVRAPPYDLHSRKNSCCLGNLGKHRGF